MAATQRQTRTGGQDKVQTALKALQEGVERIIAGEEFRRFLTMMARLHHYSSNNVMLIAMQAPGATMVAGYKRWQQLGRQVKRGEKGIAILAPVTRKLGDDTEDSTRVVAGFRVATVFDIGQTTGDPLPEPPAAEAITRASDKGAELYRRLERWLTIEGVTVDIGSCGDAFGYYRPGTKTIVVDARIVGTDHCLKTLLHETAHHLARHTGSTAPEDAESLAEGVAFVVCNRFEIETSGYSLGYISGWARDKAVLRRNLESIRQVAHHIIAALESAQDDNMCHSACAERAVEAL